MSNVSDQVIQAVKAHARANYSRDGWDYVVETFDTEELRETIAKECGDAAVTEELAIKKIGSLCRLLHEHREDIQAC